MNRATTAPRTGAALAIVLAGLIFVPACESERPAEPPRSTEPAPAFDLLRLDGSRVSLESLRGKTVLIDFWATWCPPCVLEVPELNAVWKRVQGTDTEILAVSIDELSAEEIAAWAREQGVEYPIAPADIHLALDFGGEQFPFHVLIGRDGHVLERLPPGYHDRDELLALLERHGAL